MLRSKFRIVKVGGIRIVFCMLSRKPGFWYGKESEVLRRSDGFLKKRSQKKAANFAEVNKEKVGKAIKTPLWVFPNIVFRTGDISVPFPGLKLRHKLKLFHHII